MAFKLLQDAETRWKTIRGSEDLPLLLSRTVAFKDGIMLRAKEHQEISA
jgi:hypothetical protein